MNKKLATTRLSIIAGIVTMATAAAAFVVPPPPQVTVYGEEKAPPKIAWYATLKSGLAEAERSQRPILFLSAAPQCLGVSGIW